MLSDHTPLTWCPLLRVKVFLLSSFIEPISHKHIYYECAAPDGLIFMGIKTPWTRLQREFIYLCVHWKWTPEWIGIGVTDTAMFSYFYSCSDIKKCIFLHDSWIWMIEKINIVHTQSSKYIITMNGHTIAHTSTTFTPCTVGSMHYKKLAFLTHKK